MKKKLLPLLLVSIFCFSGYTGDKLKDLKSAIIKQEYEVANQLAKDLLSDDQELKETDVVNYYLGLSYIHLKEYEQARIPLEQAVKEASDQKLKDKAYVGLFDSYYMKGEYKQALKIIEKVKKKSPRSELSSLILLKLARANLKLARWSKAKKYLEEITRKFSESFEYHIAKQLLDEKQFYAVQVGSFIDRDRAEQLVNQLQKTDEYVYIVETNDRQKRDFYRVRVGKLGRLAEAEDLKEKLAKQGYPTQIYP